MHQNALRRTIIVMHCTIADLLHKMRAFMSGMCCFYTHFLTQR